MIWMWAGGPAMWMWAIGPAIVALIYVLSARNGPGQLAGLEQWREQHASPSEEPKAQTGRDGGSQIKRTIGASLPSSLLRLVMMAGDGVVLASHELIQKVAYLAVVGTSPVSTSDHHTVAAKLDEKAPTFTVRPLPILEGRREPNTGVQFKKDEEFMSRFIVERFVEGVPLAPMSEAGDKAIRRWLSPSVRAALVECPDVWLRVDRKAMTVTLYGNLSASQIDELVQTADVIFAEHGAADGQSLLGDTDQGHVPVDESKDA